MTDPRNGSDALPEVARAAQLMTEPAVDDAAAAPPDSAGAAAVALGVGAARGAAVTVSGQAFRIVLQFAGVVVLARLLGPHDYGLLAIVVVVVGVGEIVRDFGLSNAAIAARTLSIVQRDVLFWVNAAIGVALTGVAIAAAPLIAAGFGQHELRPMVQASAVTFAFNGLATQYRADLTRRMHFARLVASDVVGQAAGLALGIALAAAGAGYWALVAQLAGQAAATLVVLVVLAGWLPGPPRRGADIRNIVHLGKNLTLANIVGYAANNVDTVTIALRLGAVPLGIYNRGFSLLMTPLNQLRSPTTTVALPVLSRLEDDHVRAGEYVKRAQLAFGYTICAGLAIMAGAAVPVVHLVLGSRWAAVAPVLALLAIGGAVTTIAYVGFWVYLSRGLGSQLLRYTTFGAVLQAGCIIGGSTWGINGVAGGFMVASILKWPVSLIWLSRLTHLPLADLLAGAARIVACGSAAGVAAWAVTQVRPDSAAAANVLLCGLAGLAVYALAVALVPSVRRDFAAVKLMIRRMRRG
jgi:PST family polysaccharide transporter